MTLEYFHDRICEELSGAEMSATELGHAELLYKMFETYYEQAVKAFTTVPEHMSKMQKCIVDKYMEGYAKVKALHDAYNK